MSIPNTPLSENQARAALERISLAEDGTLRGAVAQEALDFWSGNTVDMFGYLFRGGCQSGMIDSMVWYSSTQRFFDRHYDEIEALREDWEDQLGEPIQIRGDLKNFFAWFAFEETAFRMAREDLGLEF